MLLLYRTLGILTSRRTTYNVILYQVLYKHDATAVELYLSCVYHSIDTCTDNSSRQVLCDSITREYT